MKNKIASIPSLYILKPPESKLLNYLQLVTPSSVPFFSLYEKFKQFETCNTTLFETLLQFRERKIFKFLGLISRNNSLLLTFKPTPKTKMDLTKYYVRN